MVKVVTVNKATIDTPPSAKDIVENESTAQDNLEEVTDG